MRSSSKGRGVRTRRTKRTRGRRRTSSNSRSRRTGRSSGSSRTRRRRRKRGREGGQIIRKKNLLFTIIPFLLLRIRIRTPKSDPDPPHWYTQCLKEATGEWMPYNFGESGAFGRLECSALHFTILRQRATILSNVALLHISCLLISRHLLQHAPVGIRPALTIFNYTL